MNSLAPNHSEFQPNDPHLFREAMRRIVGYAAQYGKPVSIVDRPGQNPPYTPCFPSRQFQSPHASQPPYTIDGIPLPERESWENGRLAVGFITTLNDTSEKLAVALTLAEGIAARYGRLASFTIGRDQHDDAGNLAYELRLNGAVTAAPTHGVGSYGEPRGLSNHELGDVISELRSLRQIS